jgi:alpha-glucosidase
VQDPWEKNEPGLGLGRDPSRTPMPWDMSPNAGFTSGKPWLPLNPDWKRRNAAVESADPGSMLSLYRDLLQLRRSSRALSLGDYLPVSAQDGVLVFERRAGEERLAVALNLTHHPKAALLPPGEAWTPVLSTAGRLAEGSVGHEIVLAPDEGLILQAG